MDGLFNLILEGPSSKTKYDEYIAITQHKNRTLYLSGGVDGDAANDILMMIHLFNQEDEGKDISERNPIKLYIDSPGGSSIGCMEIIDAIELSKTPVYTIAVGGAYSAGGLVLLAGHKRFCYPHASFLWHAGSMRVEIDVGELKNLMTFNDKQETILNRYIASKTNIKEEELESKLHEDWWMTADEMLERGVIDEIVKELI